MKEYIDSTAYKAFRIVLLNFIGPCIKAAEIKRSNQLQKWWRRINGFYDYKLYKPSDVILPPPPGLWRQTARCINCNYYGVKPLTCRIVKKRWIKKMTLGRIRTMDIQNFIKRRLPQRSNNSIDYSYSVLYERFSQERLLEHDKYWSGTLCACNNKPAKIIINYKSRYNNMEFIFRELASDRLTSRTRSLVSKFVTERLMPRIHQ
jgi:hypothetical protein